jgi:hypothetical protein
MHIFCIYNRVKNFSFLTIFVWSMMKKNQIMSIGNVGSGYFNGWGTSPKPFLGDYHDSLVPQNTTQPTNVVVKPIAVDYSHFAGEYGRTNTNARWDDAPIYNTGVVLVNGGKGVINMVGNGLSALNPFNW